MRVAGTTEGTPRGPAAHGLFVPKNFRAHDKAELFQVAGHVVVDGLEILDAGRGDVEGKSSARHKHALELFPERDEPSQIFLIRHLVVVGIVREADVVGR